MQTRSKTRADLKKVEIYFDEASKAWRANKKSIGNGCYVYTSEVDKKEEKVALA